MAIERIPNGAAANPAMITLDQEKKKPESSAEAVQKDLESLITSAVKDKEIKDAGPKVDEKYMERVQKALDLSNVGREYKIYDKLGKLYIRVYDKESGEIIREIPPGDLAELTKPLQDTTGVLVNRKV